MSSTVPSGVRTLAGHDHAGHAVWDAGAGRQEGDSHDDIGNAESEADHSHLEAETQRTSQSSDLEIRTSTGFLCSLLLRNGLQGFRYAEMNLAFLFLF